MDTASSTAATATKVMGSVAVTPFYDVGLAVGWEARQSGVVKGVQSSEFRVQRVQSRSELGNSFRHHVAAFTAMRSMAAEKACQPFRWSASPLRPAGVSR